MHPHHHYIIGFVLYNTGHPHHYYIISFVLHDTGHPHHHYIIGFALYNTGHSHHHYIIGFVLHDTGHPYHYYIIGLGIFNRDHHLYFYHDHLSDYLGFNVSTFSLVTAHGLKENGRLTLCLISTSTKLTNCMCLSMVHNSSCFQQLWGFVCRRGVWEGAISISY